VLAAAALLLLAVAPAWGEGGLRVVTTSTDLKALVEAVGEEAVHVKSLAPAIHEPHSVEVKPGQLADLRSADLLVRIGLDHEPWLTPVLDTVGDARFRAGGPAVVDCSRGVELLDTETARVKSARAVHVHGFGNPHYWLDPESARPITRAIADGLARVAPGERARFEAARSRFLEELDARLARWSRAMAPYRGTRVVVVHETWPYFARRFGLVVVAAVEPSPGVPPSPAHLADLTKRMKDSGVRLVIAGPESDVSVVDHVAARGGARGVTLIPSVGGDPLARDYLALFDVNIERLTWALARR